MLGRRHLREQNRAYRSFVTVRRMADETQAIASLAAIALVVLFAPREAMLWIMIGVLAVIAVLTPPVLLWAIRKFAPPHVVARLPVEAIAAPAVADAPHTYADLVRMWRDPSWRCAHPSYAESGFEAPTSVLVKVVVTLFGISFVLAACDMALVMNLRAPARAVLAAGGAAVTAQLLLASAWRRRLQSGHYVLPTSGEIMITTFVSVLASAAITSIALARSI